MCRFGFRSPFYTQFHSPVDRSGAHWNRVYMFEQNLWNAELRFYSAVFQFGNHEMYANYSRPTVPTVLWLIMNALSKFWLIPETRQTQSSCVLSNFEFGHRPIDFFSHFLWINRLIKDNATHLNAIQVSIHFYLHSAVNQIFVELIINAYIYAELLTPSHNFPCYIFVSFAYS